MCIFQKLFSTFNHCSSFHQFPSRNFLILNSRQYTLSMPRNQKKSGSREQRWIQKSDVNQTDSSTAADGISTEVSEALTDGLSKMTITESSGQSSDSAAALRFGNVSAKGQKTIWKPKSYGTVSRTTALETDKEPAAEVVGERLGDGGHKPSSKSSNATLSKSFNGNLVKTFTVDNSTYTRAQVRATFYPKFENEKTDHEIRTRMIDMVSKGLATMEVSLKHSGSLFMYAGHEGGAYAKNSFGNVYTAVGVFVLGRTFHEAWGSQAVKKQLEFNEYLERNRMCISMELVTAVLGDHGQRPKEDYVVVTAVTDMGSGKPKFFSTPEIISFCRTWRLPTNHVWLFSTRKSVSSFFAAYDALCEEGTATPVCKALDEVADISIPGSKDHIKAQGEILEGLVARIVSNESPKHMEKVLKDFPLTTNEEAADDLGPSLREICAANRTDDMQQIKALLQSIGSSFCPNFVDWFGIEGSDSHARNADQSVISKFLQAHPGDFSTTKLQEMIRLMREKRFPAAFKCYHNFHKIDTVSSDNLHFKMVIHVHSDSAFRRYQKEMRHNPGLWPLYRGFFVDLDLFKANKEQADKIAKEIQDIKAFGMNETVRKEGLADEDANLMIKLKFLTYKLRTFLIRNGLSILFKEGPSAYRAYYLRQMTIWNTSPRKRKEMIKMLDEWAVYIRRKCGHKQLSSSVYLSEAEPFLEQYAKRSPQNQALIGSAGNLICAENFLAIYEGGRDEEGDLQQERDIESLSPSKAVRDSVAKDEGVIVFFPGIPGCAKSALCKEILNAQGGLDDDRPVHTLMGDLIKGKYWQKIADERRRKPYSILLADKNAPNEEVWKQIEDMCRSTKASAVPVVPDSEGTETNPFSLDALAVFVCRVLQRVNHPGNLDKSSPNAGYVLLMFYHLYDGKSRKEFESELIERFGSLVKMPLLISNRSPLPDPVKSVLEEGINLYQLHRKRFGRLESTKGAYAVDWAIWEKKLREVVLENAEYLTSVQVPFEVVVEQVLKQLKAVANGEYITPLTEKRKFGTIVFAAVSLPAAEIHQLLDDLANKDPAVEAFLKDKNVKSSLTKAHVTLAHKGSHGVAAVANYGSFLHQNVPMEITALLFSKTLAALEALPGSVDGEKVTSKNQWPHVTLWTAAGVPAKEANTLVQLHSEGKATRVEINPPITLTGILEFY